MKLGFVDDSDVELSIENINRGVIGSVTFD